MPGNRRIRHCHHHHHHGRDHAAGDHEQRRFQLPRSLFDPSITTEAQRAQIDRGGAATAHQATESTHETAEFATATATTTTAEITQQVTTNGTDSTSYGRDSILASPPRLNVLR